MQVAPESSTFLSQWYCYFTNIAAIQWHEMLLSVLCILMIVFTPKITKKIPGSLFAIILGTGVSLYCSSMHGLNFTTIGSKFPELAQGVSLPMPSVPEMNIDLIISLFPSAFTIALLCAIESLLAAMVADGVTGQKHDSNTELIGQGIANIVTPFFGGIPATGAIARTMASINNGGRTPVAGIVHAVVLLLIFLFLLPFAVHIPFAALAAILIVVAYNMSEWRSFRYLLKGEKSDVIVLLITFFLTVIIDLTVAIQVGLLMAVLLFVNRVMKTSKVVELNEQVIAATEDEESEDNVNVDHPTVPEGVEIFQIEGPFFFGLANKIEELDPEIRQKNVEIRIIRMRKVPFIDSTGVNNLRSLFQRSQKAGIRLILSGVTPEVFATLQKYDLATEIGEEFILSHISLALEKAEQFKKQHLSQTK